MSHDGHKVGYIRLASFSQKAANDMRRAIDRLEVCLHRPGSKTGAFIKPALPRCMCSRLARTCAGP